MDIRNLLREVIKKSITDLGFDYLEFDDDCCIADYYNIDSISTVYLIVEIENRFEIHFDDDDLLSLFDLTFNEIVALIEKQKYNS